MKIAVLVFPGTWSDGDWLHVLNNVMDQDAERVWHREDDLRRFDVIVLPGGFSYGDYLRTGAIARFSPVMDAVKREAATGKLVIGSCNGFQILCESGLLPGVLIRNNSMQFRCQDALPACRDQGHCLHDRRRKGRRAADAHRPRRRQLLRRPRNACHAQRRRPRRSSATQRPPAKLRRKPTPTAPWRTSPASATKAATSSA